MAGDVISVQKVLLTFCIIIAIWSLHCITRTSGKKSQEEEQCKHALRPAPAPRASGKCTTQCYIQESVASRAQPPISACAAPRFRGATGEFDTLRVIYHNCSKIWYKSNNNFFNDTIHTLTIFNDTIRVISLNIKIWNFNYKSSTAIFILRILY